MKLWITPSNRCLTFFSVVIRCLVQKFGTVFQGNKAMGEAFRNPQHVLVDRTELYPNPLTESGRVSTATSNAAPFTTRTNLPWA